MRTPLGLIAYFILLFFLTSPISAKTWYIKADGSGDAPTIQAGVDSAAAGDTVLVAGGVYSDSVQVTIDGTPAWTCVYLYKNIILQAESLLAATIDGSKNQVVVYAEAVDSTTSIQGFIIQTTYSDYACVLPARSPAFNWDGGTGIYCRSAPITIVHNELRDHHVGLNFIESAAHISENHVYRCGFGLVLDVSSDATIQSNQVHACATLIQSTNSSPCITDNHLYADIQNLEIVCTGVVCMSGSAYIARNDIVSIHNTGMAVGGNAIVEYNRFIDHWEALLVAGINPNPTIRYNLFYNAGHGIYQYSAGTPNIHNNTFDNCGMTVFAGFIEFSNNIITRSSTGIYCGPSSVVRCNNMFDISGTKYSCGDRTGIDGNISVDPQFCGIPDSENYYLQSDSPCASGNHPDGVDCGQIGAFGVNCGTVPVGGFTFGSLKALFSSSNTDTLSDIESPLR